MQSTVCLILKYEDQTLRSHKEFHSALLDVNSAIREEGQYFFRRSATLDLRSYYLGALKSSGGVKLSSAIAAIGEVRESNDSTLLEGFVTEPSTRVRGASIRAIGRLDPHAYIELFLHALHDTSAKVAREGLLALRKKANLIGGQRLWETYSHCRHVHGKRAVLHLLARLSKWDSIPFLIQSLADEDTSLAELGRKYVARWFARYNRSFVPPNADQLAMLRAVLDRCGLLVSSGTQQQLESLLKSF